MSHNTQRDMKYNFIIGPTDTDSISFCKADMREFNKEELNSLLSEINEISPEFMVWADDGYYKTCIVVAAKNYVLVDFDNNMTIKGSALKATTKEKALQRFVKEIIQLLVDNNQNLVESLYYRYAREIVNLKDITEWCSKHTITKAVLTGQETTQVRIREALKGRSVQEGDKCYQFVKIKGERCMREDFDGTYCVKTLLGKLYDTLSIFENIIDTKTIPNLARERNQPIVESLKCQPQNVTTLAPSSAIQQELSIRSEDF